MAIKLVKVYVNNVKNTEIVKEITKHINQKLNSSDSVESIRVLMKRDTKWVIKGRNKKKQIMLILERIKLLVSCFIIKFFLIIPNKILLINIDESSINRSSKIKY